ncbi:LacI family DNA-binding transcriptional regulator [Paraburkholderia sabiae]|uniref:LacI family DNA-binding transcriptional regulator n=1 Tax=Paraburkholderia sabiae TaxID=273251 RepID=A0ABU9QHX5_9BURK|nr:LacI family DNA-binding transcriptional regulator [Paraburkholderia sabiae]WJZ77428.1 LacI family DNA-binding transcriptional regulator [Paraburkholderia sabiae]CAD6557784.1 Catabolite control protein A [Paraburkholderia sabiae]
MSKVADVEESVVSKPRQTRSRAGRPEGNVTLVDVARLAEVSIASVSRVLNNPDKVTPDIRTRVEAAIRRLGFVPNGAARALRSTKARLVGAIIPTLNYAIYARMVESLQQRLSDQGISLILNSSGYSIETEYREARLLAERGVEVVVLVGDVQRHDTLTLLREQGISCVLTYSNSEDPSVPSIGFNNAEAAGEVGRYLHSLGHRKFLMISGMSRHNDRVRDRKLGFLTQLGALGVPSSDVIVVEEEYSMAAGYAAMQRQLEAGREFTAVFCGTDVLAAGALKACDDAGLNCPEDISLVGFDNLEFGEYLKPSLTTVDVSGVEMGRLTANAVSQLLAGGSERVHVKLETPLIVRHSTGPVIKDKS